LRLMGFALERHPRMHSLSLFGWLELHTNPRCENK
jgi:hypothetical protein